VWVCGPVKGAANGAVAPREEARLADKSWAGVLAGVKACARCEGLWALVTPELYAAFWALGLPDVYVPVKR
jgi:THO complex subunit 2